MLYVLHPWYAASNLSLSISSCVYRLITRRKLNDIWWRTKTPAVKRVLRVRPRRLGQFLVSKQGGGRLQVGRLEGGVCRFTSVTKQSFQPTTEHLPRECLACV